MSLNDPFFTKFDGSPDTGRVPTRLIVLGSTGLSESQLRGVDHVYGQFRNACKLSASDFHTEQVKLQDGTIVHMWSLQGRDEVTVTPGDAAEEDRLPHGFAVVTNWQAATIYKRVISGPVGPTYPYWEFAGDYVPQVEAGKTIFDNQAFRVADPMAAEKDYFNLPMVYSRSDKTLWDYALRGGLTSSSSFVTPFNIKNSLDSSFEFTDPHYAAEDKIKDVDGAVLYTVPATDNILLPTAPEYPDEPHYWPAQTDAEGNQLVMQHWRYAVISPSANVWKFRICNERLRRMGDTAYEAIERNVQDVVTPWGTQTVGLTNVDDGAIGESPDPLLYSTIMELGPGGVGGTDGSAYWGTGWRERALDISGVVRRNSYTLAMRNIVTQTAGAATLSKILAAGGPTEGAYIDILQELNYPADILWRGGEGGTGYYISDIYGTSFTQEAHGTHRAVIKRKDTHYHVDGTPKVTAKLGWKDLLLVEGTTTGRMDGRVYENILDGYGNFTRAGYSHIIYEIYQSSNPAAPNYVPAGAPFYAWLNANNIRWGYYETLRLAKSTVSYGGPNPITTSTMLYNERPANTVSYALKTRYVIDYDHKGRFYAAIRVEVTCTGAAWAEDSGVYDGYMVETSAPTYNTKIYFESNWDGIEASQLLYEETLSRPGWEIMTIEKWSPWYWPFPAYIERSCRVRIPPQPVPAEDFMMQFQNLAGHQGVNTNLCCADVRPDITGDEVVKTQSEEGIEYSYLQDGQVIPHTKYVTGQLYARTFRITDFFESVWLLKALKFNALQDNLDPAINPTLPDWYYHSALKSALGVQRHIEVRDGIIVQWSDNLPGETSGYPPTPADPPAATGREINLYRV